MSFDDLIGAHPTFLESGSIGEFLIVLKCEVRKERKEKKSFMFSFVFLGVLCGLMLFATFIECPAECLSVIWLVRTLHFWRGASSESFKY